MTLLYRGVSCRPPGKTLLAALLVAANTSAQALEPQEGALLAKEAQQIIKPFGEQLKNALQAAMQAGGPISALEVCQNNASRIAAEATPAPWTLKRTSLKVRNSANRADIWEREVLLSLEARKAQGEPLTSLSHFEVLEQDGEQLFRFMKAIPTGQACLTCHGSQLAEPVQAEIRRRYPNDRATGFAFGDIRGAFSLTFPLAKADAAGE